MMSDPRLGLWSVGESESPDAERGANYHRSAGRLHCHVLSVFRPPLRTSAEKGLPSSVRSRDNLCPLQTSASPGEAFCSEKWVLRPAYGIFDLYPDTNLLQPGIRTRLHLRS